MHTFQQPFSMWTWISLFPLDFPSPFILGLWPRAGFRVVRLDPFHFLAGCYTRRLNQALTVLSLSLDFFRVCVVLLTRATSWFVLFECCGWRFGVAVTCWSRSMQLLYIEPGLYLRAGKLSHYVTSHPGQLSLSSFWVDKWVVGCN